MPVCVAISLLAGTLAGADISDRPRRLDTSAEPDEPSRAARANLDRHTRFEIRIDEFLWRRWAFEYPVTYVFRVLAGSSTPVVSRRDRPHGAWSPLPVRHATEFFNGVEAVRYDAAHVYVSVGFAATNSIQLRFEDADVRFLRVARYYDDRTATYTLSNDNWGKDPTANPGVECETMTDDACDKYHASILATRSFNLPQSIGINSRMAGDQPMWALMQRALDRGDRAWEPAVHTQHHPCNFSEYYRYGGYRAQIIGCRDDLLAHLTNIPYGDHIFEFVLPCGHTHTILRYTAAREFLFLREWDEQDHIHGSNFAEWDVTCKFYGPGGFQTASYDRRLASRQPAGLYSAADVQQLNDAFDDVLASGGIFYAMWHADRYDNSVIYSTDPPVDGASGSTLMAHWEHVANRLNVWYVANGWLYAYKIVADNVHVTCLDDPPLPRDVSP